MRWPSENCPFRAHRWGRCFLAARMRLYQRHRGSAWECRPAWMAWWQSCWKKIQPIALHPHRKWRASYQSIAERLTAPRPPRSRLRPIFAIPAIVLLLLLAAGGVWLYQRFEQRQWAREQAIPEINRLAPDRPLAAFLVLQKAEKILPGDSQLASIAKPLTRRVSIQSSPPGAKVEIQDYTSANGAWLALGATPLSGVLIPNGYFRWRVSKPGAGQLLVAPFTADTMQFALAPAGTAAGMVHVPKGVSADLIDFIGWVINDLPAYDIDQFEVTNRQYQEFVDEGGYQKRQYWKQKFIKDGKEIAWDQAMDLFRDPTGRPGPSIWEGGHFPQGQADYPVSGVSWYEAAAYAEFAGKSLPTLAQWYQVAPPDARGLQHQSE